MSLQRRIERLEQLHEERATVDAARSMAVRRVIVDGAPFGRCAVAVESDEAVGLPEVRALPGESTACLVDRAAKLIRWPEPKGEARHVEVRIFVRTAEGASAESPADA
jgi:hypothetical protein